MNDEASFLTAIKQNPDKDLPRLVFADWLEEHGQSARAEFIRCQIEEAKFDWRDARREVWTNRAQILLREWGTQWFGPWAERGAFHRGLIHAHCRASEFRDRVAAGGHAGLQWVEKLHLTGEAEQVLPLLQSPHFAGLAGLHIQNTGLRAGGAALLAASPHLARLSHLNLAQQLISDI